MIRESELVRNRYRKGLYDYLKVAVGALANHYYNGFQITGLENIQNNRSNLFLMNHRSHFDYVFLNYVLFRNKKDIPFIAGRDNIFKYLFFGGVFGFIGRTITVKNTSNLSIEEKKRYSRALSKDVKRIVKANQDIAIFLEGGRDYQGHLGEPKSGVVRKVLKAKENMRVIPVTFSYDYVVESEFFEKLENAKKGSFKYIATDVWAFIKNGLEIFSTCTKNGKIYLNFGEGFDLNEYLGKPKAPRLVCDRAWDEIVRLYKPPRINQVIKEVEEAQNGNSTFTLEVPAAR